MQNSTADYKTKKKLNVVISVDYPYCSSVEHMWLLQQMMGIIPTFCKCFLLFLDYKLHPLHSLPKRDNFFFFNRVYKIIGT